MYKPAREFKIHSQRDQIGLLWDPTKRVFSSQAPKHPHPVDSRRRRAGASERETERTGKAPRRRRRRDTAEDPAWHTHTHKQRRIVGDQSSVLRHLRQTLAGWWAHAPPGSDRGTARADAHQAGFLHTLEPRYCQRGEHLITHRQNYTVRRNSRWGEFHRPIHASREHTHRSNGDGTTTKANDKRRGSSSDKRSPQQSGSDRVSRHHRDESIRNDSKRHSHPRPEKLHPHTRNRRL